MINKLGDKAAPVSGDLHAAKLRPPRPRAKGSCAGVWVPRPQPPEALPPAPDRSRTGRG